MNQKKMCKYCDGLIDFDVIACPYCGNNVSLEKKEEETFFPPPYQEEENEEKVSKFQISKFPFFIFSFGLNITFFGIFLFLFSTKGKIFLSWNSNLWFLYILLGLPIMFIGSKLFKKNSEE